MRQLNCVDWGQAVAALLALNWEECPIAAWKSVLVEFQRDFELVGWVIQMVKDCQARLTRTRSPMCIPVNTCIPMGMLRFDWSAWWERRPFPN